MDARKAKVTLQHLLTQTSGLHPMRAFDPVTFEKLGLADHLIQQPMDAEPGAVWLYNNNAVDALALIAERAAGKTLDGFLDQRCRPGGFRTRRRPPPRSRRSTACSGGETWPS